MGWLDIHLSRWIIFGLTLCLVAMCLREKDSEIVSITRRQRILFLLCALFVYLAFLVGMMVWWTKAGTSIIQGIQGRYFIPVLPLILFSLYGLNKKEVRKGFGHAVILASIVLSLSSLANMFARYCLNKRLCVFQ